MSPLFPTSTYVPVIIGFFGLAVGYIILGGQALFKFPASSPSVNKTLAIWALGTAGFMQFITGVYLMVGLTWFHVFAGAPLYMAALAFTAYGVHWMILGWQMYIPSSDETGGWMTLVFFFLSLLGILVFWSPDLPVAIVFIGLTLIYLFGFLTGFRLMKGERIVAFFRFVTGIWLIYLVYAIVLNTTNSTHLVAVTQTMHLFA
ncbi:MAG TPA: hypothetical protein VGN34_28935 [Ktedonobacteraceae bacterium]|jgi:hypothetical protein